MPKVLLRYLPTQIVLLCFAIASNRILWIVPDSLTRNQYFLVIFTQGRVVKLGVTVMPQ
jgi:hypothetical protein